MNNCDKVIKLESAIYIHDVWNDANALALNPICKVFVTKGSFHLKLKFEFYYLLFQIVVYTII